MMFPQLLLLTCLLCCQSLLHNYSVRIHECNTVEIDLKLTKLAWIHSALMNKFCINKCVALFVNVILGTFKDHL